MKLKIALILGFALLLGLNDNITTAQTDTEVQNESIKIGIAMWVEGKGFNENIEGFKETLEEFGFIEGSTVKYFEKNANGDKTKFSEIIQEFIKNDVDIIFSQTTTGTLIAKQMTQEIPIVFSIVTYPVRANIVESFESSGNNLVGTSNYVPVEKQIDLIYDITKSRQIGFLHRQGEVNSEMQFEQMKQYSQTNGINLLKISLTNLDEAENKIKQTLSEIDVLYNACDTLIQTGGEEISIKIGLEKKIPVFSCNKEGIELGALAGNVADFKLLGKMSGIKAMIILSGGDPSDIRSEKINGDYIFVNTESRKILGISLPTHVENIIYQEVG